MEFIDSKIDDYVCSHTSDESELLKELNRETHVKILRPRMLSGHYQGRLLSMLSKLINPKYILELGTYTGYSALCLAEGLRNDGKLITIDVNEELEDFTQSFFDRSSHKNQIDFRIGDALKIIPTLELDFDLVFIDADKLNYLNYYHLVFDKLKPGGIIITDNVLWSGKVVEEIKPTDKDTLAMHEFNQFVKQDARVETILLPIRDGIMVTRKVS